MIRCICKFAVMHILIGRRCKDVARGKCPQTAFRWRRTGFLKYRITLNRGNKKSSIIECKKGRYVRCCTQILPYFVQHRCNFSNRLHTHRCTHGIQATYWSYSSAVATAQPPLYCTTTAVLHMRYVGWCLNSIIAIIRHSNFLLLLLPLHVFFYKKLKKWSSTESFLRVSWISILAT